MADAATSDRDALLAFELALDEQVCDEVRQESWGRIFLTPSTPLIWDANWVGIERVGLGVGQVIAIAEEALGGAGFAHRTVCVLDQADGRRIAEELEADPARWPGWEVERTRYMVWHGGKPRSPPRRSQFAPDSGQKCERHRGVGVREVCLEEIEGLRRALLAEEAVPSGVAEPRAVVDQLFELDRRYGEAGGDRWLVAPADDEPLAACRLLRDGRIAQVEDVGTREHARERGHAKAIVLAAIAAAGQRATRRSSSPPTPPTGHSSSTPSSASRRSATDDPPPPPLTPAPAFAVLVAIRPFLRTHWWSLYIWDTGAGQRLYGRINLLSGLRH